MPSTRIKLFQDTVAKMNRGEPVEVLPLLELPSTDFRTLLVMLKANEYYKPFGSTIYYRKGKPHAK